MFPVLSASGPIAQQEGALIVHAALLMLIVVLPVLGLLFFFAWRYRAGNKHAAYMPEWEHSKLDELVWWAVPLEIVLVLAALTWTSTHQLDPYKPLASDAAPLQVQAVALPWKWLFIYPAEGIATVNYLYLPAGVPIDFSITADAPMNSFWIPALGGQIYAMTGMSTPLHLQADTPGVYRGLSANYSGEGFAKMTFDVVAVAPDNFGTWAATVRTASSTLDGAAYATLREPGTMGSASYGAVEPGIFDAILHGFNGPDSTGHYHH